MDAIAIEVPDMNDSVSKITLLGTQYQIRFTYNDTEGYWYFGLVRFLGQSYPHWRKDCPSIPSQPVLGRRKYTSRRVRRSL